MAEVDYKELANQALELIGGKENVTNAMHCVTRLRINVKDKGLVKLDDLKGLKGFIDVVWAGDQLQIIIGQEVRDFYPVFCTEAGISEQEASEENLDPELTEKKKFSIKSIGNGILNYISGTVTSIIPVFIFAGLAKAIAVVIGPDLLNWVDESNTVYFMLNTLYDVGFYFLPVYLAYGAAKALKTDTSLALFCALLLFVPDIVDLIGVQDTISVFGISAPVQSYAQSFLPVVLGVWIMSYIYKFVKKIMPTLVSSLLTPFVTAVIMTPIMLVVCAPLGSYIGQAIGAISVTISNGGFLVRAIGQVVIGAIIPYLVVFGMHNVLIMSALVTMTEVGFDTFLLPPSIGYAFGLCGMALAAMIKMKKPENKGQALGYFVSDFIGGISEPGLYGLALKYRSCTIILTIVGAIAGLYCAILQPAQYVVVGIYNVFTTTVPWIPGGLANTIEGVILIFGSVALGFVLTMLYGNFGDD